MRNAILTLCLVLTSTPYAAADSLTDKAENDQVERVRSDDPHMLQAYEEASKTLTGFLTLAQNPEPGTTSYSVKVGIAEGDNTEYFWITPFSFDGETFSGVVSNQPRVVSNVTAGQQISFNRSDIVDWLYMDTTNGKMVGNFTACAMLQNSPPEEAREFMNTYGLECEQ